MRAWGRWDWLFCIISMTVLIFRRKCLPVEIWKVLQDYSCYALLLVSHSSWVKGKTFFYYYFLCMKNHLSPHYCFVLGSWLPEEVSATKTFFSFGHLQPPQQLVEKNKKKKICLQRRWECTETRTDWWHRDCLYWVLWKQAAEICHE